MKFINLHRKKIFLHDGLEDEFIYKKQKIECPICKGNILFSVYGSQDFDELNKYIQDNIAKSITGLEKTDCDDNSSYKYKRFSLMLNYTKCDVDHHDFAVVFSFGEEQPARYQAYLLGLFNINSSQLIS